MNTNKKVKLTILVPCYNVEKYLDECLRSLANQTLSNINVICINDGSTDNTKNIIEQYVKKDNRFYLFDKNNSGYGDSMNKGLALVRTKYVGIVESDDFVDSDMFEVLLNNAERNRLDISRCGFFTYFSQERQEKELFSFVPKNKVIEPIKEMSVFYQAPSIWCSIYRTDFLRQNKIQFMPTPGASYQDTSFAFKAYFKCKRFMMIDRSMLHYRQHPESSVHSVDKADAVRIEWNEIIRYASMDCKRFGYVKNCLPELMNWTYRWNASRLKNELQYNFVKGWRSDIRLLESRGIAYRPRGLRKRIENIIFRKSVHLFLKYSRLRNWRS
jgi:hypothetical protein